jgi:hypothetical protein
VTAYPRQHKDATPPVLRSLEGNEERLPLQAHPVCDIYPAGLPVLDLPDGALAQGPAPPPVWQGPTVVRSGRCRLFGLCPQGRPFGGSLRAT